MPLLPACFVLLLATGTSALARAEPPYPITPAPVDSGSVADASPVSLAVDPSLLAYRELSLLQQREAWLWERHDALRLGGPIAALAVGAPLGLGFLPAGALTLQAARNSAVIGRSLLAVGLVGLAALTYGAVRVSQLRRRRSAQERELRAIAARRSVLERMLAPFGEGARF